MAGIHKNKKKTLRIGNNEQVNTFVDTLVKLTKKTRLKHERISL